MAVPNKTPDESEFSHVGLEPLDTVTGRPYPVSRGGRYRGTSPRPGVPDDRADPGSRVG